MNGSKQCLSSHSQERRSSRHFPWQRFLILLLLLLIFIATIQYKFYLLSRNPSFRLPDSIGAFWTESAFHFRHALMVKEGLGIPHLDRQIQYPEGIEIWKHCTPVMDWFYGTVYRMGWTMDLPFHQFIMKAQSIWSSLAILAIFIGSMALWQNRWNALLATIFYAFSLGFMDRGLIYLRENFALPFLWMFLALFLISIRSESKSRSLWLSIASALCLSLALASWHVTRFYYLMFLAGLVITQLPLKGARILDNTYFQNLRRTLLIITGASMIASIILPVLKQTVFLLAPSMMLSYGLLFCYYVLPLFSRLKGKIYYFLSFLLLTSLFLISYLLEKAMGLYSHVEELFKAKIRFLGILPEDPNRVSFEAKLVWNGPLVSPSLETFTIIALPGLIVLALVTGMMLRNGFRKKGNRLAVLILFLSFSALGSYVLVSRMHILIHAPVAFLASYLGCLSIRKRTIWGRSLLIGLILLQIFLLLMSQITVMQPNINVIRSLVQFIQKETPEDAVFACEFNLGPTIACDAKRSVLVQSKFENIKVRKKIEELYRAMLEDEETLLSVCQKYGASHFILGADIILNTTKDSIRYIVGKTGITKNMVAYQMHFQENQLQHFQLIFQNPNYRIFKISDEPSPPLPPDQYWPIWDAQMQGLSQVQGRSLPDELLKKALYNGTNVFSWIRTTRKLKAMGREEEAESLLMRAIYPAMIALEKKWRYRSPDISSLIGLIADSAEEAAQIFARHDQAKEAALVMYRMARLFAMMNDPHRSLQFLDEANRYDPKNEQITIIRNQLLKRNQK